MNSCKVGLICVAFSLLLLACKEKSTNEQVLITNNPALQDSPAVYDYCDVYLSCNTNAIGINGLLKARTVMTVVDVRDADSYNEGHVPTPINMPFGDYDSFEGDQLDFPELKKDRFTYVYCYEEFCNLAHRAARKFASLGYPVKIMRGGYESWQKRDTKLKNNF